EIENVASRMITRPRRKCRSYCLTRFHIPGMDGSARDFEETSGETRQDSAGFQPPPPPAEGRRPRGGSPPAPPPSRHIRARSVALGRSPSEAIPNVSRKRVVVA